MGNREQTFEPSSGEVPAAPAPRSGDTLSDIEKQVATALLTQFTALRAEIQNRSTFQATIVSVNITAIGVIAGFYFTQHADPRVLFVIPILSPILGMMYVDHDVNIGNIGRFIQSSIIPELARVTGVAGLPDYEVFVREFERRGSFRVFVFGIPVLFMFALLPLGALILPFLPDTSRHPTLWAPAGVGSILVVAFIVAWMGMVRRGNTFWGRLIGRRPAAGSL
jgi:drug/metabolite transporter (DMT)-like permease